MVTKYHHIYICDFFKKKFRQLFDWCLHEFSLKLSFHHIFTPKKLYTINICDT